MRSLCKQRRTTITMGVLSATFVFLSTLNICLTWAQSTDSTVTWFDNLPAVAMEYKIHIDAGKEDCYFQYVAPKAALYVSFHVVRGGDGNAGFAVRHPNGQIVHPYEWRPSGEYQEEASIGGYYSVCIDNQFSRFASKIINLYMTVVRYDEWDKYTKELEDLNISAGNFTTTVNKLEQNLNVIRQEQHHSRSWETRDYNILVDNNRYVQQWSIGQILVVITTTVLQVYFVRKLFEIKNVRPRA